MKRTKIAAAIGCSLLAVLAIIPAPVAAQGETNAGQQVINYFIDLFNADWAIGSAYDNNTDGMGLAQNRSITGSPSFIKQDPQFISESMNITPVLSPDNSEAAIISIINSAKESLFIEQIYVSGNLNDILLAIEAAHQRGVDVRVIQDHNGHNEDGSNILTSMGVPVRLLKPNASIGASFDSQHNKGVIVDGKLTLICSINWSPNSIRNNREAGLIVESETVAAYYTDLFMYDWERSEPYVSTGPGSLLIEYGVEPFVPTTYSGTMNVTCIASPDNCFDVVNDILANARESIYISVYTLSSPYLIDSLYERIGAGVDVRLLLEKNQVGFYEKAYNRWTMFNLTMLGNDGNTASGLWASSSFTFQHSKYAIIDNATLIISSGNWGQNSCPKPREDNNQVRGNRDWWFVVYGDGAYVPTGEFDPNGADPGDLLDLLLSLGVFDPLLFAAITGLAITGVAWLVKRRVVA